MEKIRIQDDLFHYVNQEKLNELGLESTIEAFDISMKMK